MARRNHGGTIRKLPSGRWQARIHNPATGQHKSLGTFPTKADAKAHLDKAIQQQRDRGTVSDPTGTPTVSEYVAQWISDNQNLRSPKTVETYQWILTRRIDPLIGHARIGLLTITDIRQWLTALADETSPSVANKAYRLLRAALNTATDDGLIRQNPCRVKGAGIDRRTERPVATVTEVTLLADTIDPRYRAFVLIAAWCGLRISEITGLTVEDIDLAHGWVNISKQLQRVNGQLVHRPPKSQAGNRRVAIPAPLIPTLQQHINDYTTGAPTEFVFTTPTGLPVDKDRFNRRWRKLRTEVGLEHLRFHDLRHTGNTLAASTGASTRELMARMGHSSMEAAIRYQHATDERDQLIADKLGAMMPDNL